MIYLFLIYCPSLTDIIDRGVLLFLLCLFIVAPYEEGLFNLQTVHFPCTARPVSAVGRFRHEWFQL